MLTASDGGLFGSPAVLHEPGLITGGRGRASSWTRHLLPGIVGVSVYPVGNCCASALNDVAMATVMAKNAIFIGSFQRLVDPNTVSVPVDW